MASKKRCNVVCLLTISNIMFCMLLFVEYMTKFDYLNLNINEINTLQIIQSNNENENENDGVDMIEDMISWAIKPYSICYLFSKQKNVDMNNENKIALVTVSDLSTYPHPTSWLPLSRMNRLLYASNFSYDYCDFPRDWDFTTLRETRWVKFGALYTILRLSYYKYVVWLDTDTLFWNENRIPFNKYALKWFDDNRNLSVLFSDHGKHGADSHKINAGIFILKNNNFSLYFLEQCYANYVNTEMTQHHADQDAFSHFYQNYNENNQIMVVNAKYLQSIYVQANPQKFEKNYKELNVKQSKTIIFHRVAGGGKKYFQMNDVIKDWMDAKILNKIRDKCPECEITNNETWRTSAWRTNMYQHTHQKGYGVLRPPKI